MLQQSRVEFYKVKAGQTIEKIAEYFSVSEYLLSKINALTEPPYAGQILRIPAESGNAYFVQAGDTKELLCGSAENYLRKNGTDIFYIGMRIIL